MSTEHHLTYVYCRVRTGGMAKTLLTIEKGWQWGEAAFLRE
jgi:hypothetical protein